MIVGNQLAPATPRQKAYLRQLMRECRRSSEEIQAVMAGRLTQSMASHQIKRYSEIARYYKLEKVREYAWGTGCNQSANTRQSGGIQA